VKAWATLPTLAVRLGDGELPAADADTLVAVQVRQAVQAPAQCEVIFRDPGGPLLKRASGLVGGALDLGVDGAAEALFSGEVTAVELAYGADGERELRVRGYDRLHRLRKHQPVRMFTDVDARTLAEQLVADCGLEVDGAVSGPAWPLLMQWRQTDLDLLAETAARAGLWFAASGGALRLFSLEGTGDPIPLALGETLFEARLELNGEHAIEAVHALAWDPLTGKRSDAEATAARTARAIQADVAASAFGSDGRRTLCDIPLPGPQAEAAAQAVIDRACAARAGLWGVAQGDPALRPGARVEVAGVATAFVGTYVITEVTHTVDAERGYLSEISSRLPAPVSAPRPDGAVVTSGLVTSVDDPEGLGRVQASLPTYPSLVTGWMRVVVLAAGPDKGLVCLPDVDDEVLVVLPRGDPSLGLVLGGLFGAHAPPDQAGVAHAAVRRHTWRTAGGQQVQLDDDGRSIALTNQGGSSLTLAPKQVVLHAATDLEISAPGRKITIRADSVDFRKA
jgi:phage baseplate assembly protein gpV